MTANVWLLVALAMLFYAGGEYMSKCYANAPAPGKFALAILLYMLNAMLFLPALNRFNSLSRLGTVWNLAYIMVTLVLAVAVFHEALTVRHWVGIVLALVSVWLLST